MSTPVRKNSSRKSGKFNKSVSASKGGEKSEDSKSKTVGVDGKGNEVDTIKNRTTDRIDERIPDSPITVFKKSSGMDKIQAAGKGLTKRALLEKIQNSIKNKTGYLPSLNEAIICAAQSYLDDIHLNKQQTSKIELAATAAKMTPIQILDKACDWASRFYSNKYSVEAQDAKNQKGNGALDEFSAGSAYLRIHEFVTKLMKKNDSSKKKEDMVFINQTYLTKHQGSNRDAIKGYLQLHAGVLDKHHKKHNLNPRHNLEVNTYFGKLEKISERGKEEK